MNDLDHCPELEGPKPITWREPRHLHNPNPYETNENAFNETSSSLPFSLSVIELNNGEDMGGNYFPFPVQTTGWFEDFKTGEIEMMCATTSKSYITQ